MCASPSYARLRRFDGPNRLTGGSQTLRIRSASMRSWRIVGRPRRKVLLWVAAVAVGAAAVGGYAAVSSKSPPVRTEVLRVAVAPETDGAPVTLDATLYLPDSKKPAPAVVL